MQDRDSLFLFEKLDVYVAAREALTILVGKRAGLRGLPGEIASQLERAAVSTVANIAEASGRATQADRRHRYTIARAEANEAGAMVELALLLGGLDAETHRALRSRYLRVVYMLTALMRR